MKHRAYSLLNIKSIDEEQRVITGIASTPTPDRMGDIVEPSGVKFKLPLPLLWQHDSGSPIGHVETATVTKDGIEITARLVNITDPGKLKDRLDEAWQSIKSGLVRGLSIGFSALESARIKDTWSQHFLEWEWLELSAVTIAANADASILSIKSADQRSLAATGVKRSRVVQLSAPGASGTTLINPKGHDMNLAQQIAAFEAKRAACLAQRDEIQTKAIDAGRSKDEAEKQAFDHLTAEIDTIDAELKDLRIMEKQAIGTARTITAGDGESPAAAAAARGTVNSHIISVGAASAPGVKFARYAMAMYRGEGNPQKALACFSNEKRWMDSTPEVATVLKAAIAAGDTTTSGWASELVYNENLANEFIEYLRPMTILGKLGGLRRVPFNVRMGSQTAPGTAYWVGQGLPIPMSKPTVGSLSLGIAKIAGLMAIDDELMRSSSPSAELLVRDDLAKTISTFMDVQFVDPNVAAVANVNPASMTNGVTPVTATGTTAAAFNTDIATLMGQWGSTEIDPSKGYFIMTPNQAMRIGLMRSSLGVKIYPELNINGGFLEGLPVIVSNSANIPGSPDSGNMILLVNPPEILLADDGQVTVDLSNQASIQMLDNPTNQSTGATVATTMVSMFQTHSTALRATRYINWVKRRSNAVVYIREAAYAA